MANVITVGRSALLFVAVVFLYRDSRAFATAAVILLGVIFAGDALDGWIARRTGSTSDFGAMLDIAGDRLIETVLWVVFADLGLVGIWVPLLVITRGLVVDTLRALAYAEGMTAFGTRTMMRSPLTRWLSASRFMGGLYGCVKALAFVFLAGLLAAQTPVSTESWLRDAYNNEAVRFAGWLMVWLAVALNVIRGLPVVFDAIPSLVRPRLRSSVDGDQRPPSVGPRISVY